MMTWVISAGVLLGFGLWLGRRRRTYSTTPSEPVSTLRLELSRRQDRKKKAALDAATGELR
jgi:hypothetical protein